jgi:hypothetical protein
MLSAALPRISNRRMAMAALFSLLLFAFEAQALEVKGLYEAEVVAEGEEAAQRNSAIRAAFEKMLVKVTGHRNIAARTELSDDLDKAARYVQQYSYRLEDMPVDPAVEQEAAVPKRYLKVAFDAQAVDRLLRQRRLPVWSSNRPSGLVWLGEEVGGKRRLVGGEGIAAESVQLSAMERGVPLDFPLMDLEDQAKMRVADLWGDFERAIWGASYRYSPDFVLTGRLISMGPTLWRAQWRLYHGDRLSSWERDGADQSLVAYDGVQHAVDLLAARYAPIGSASDSIRVRLRIAGIGDIKDYAGVGRFLRSQSMLEWVGLESVQADVVTYDLQVRGGVEVLEQGLELGGLIERDPEAPPGQGDFAERVDLNYRLRQ